jgi:hypothetical protein
MQVTITLETGLGELVQQLATMERCTVEQWLLDVIEQAARQDGRILGLALPQKRPTAPQDT